MKRFLQQAWLYFKGQHMMSSFEEYALFEVLNPFLTLVFYCLVASYSFGTTNLSSWVAGNAMLLSVTSCVYTIGSSFSGERMYGRLKSIIAAPRSKILCVLEKALFPVAASIVTVFIGFLLGCLLFRVDFSTINILFLIFAIFSGIFAITGLSMFISVLGIAIDSIDFVLNSLMIILMIFTGAEFPISQLPYLLQYVSKILPLTRSIEAINLLFSEFRFSEYLLLVIGEIVLGTIYFFVCILLLKIMEKVAIKRATIELF